MTDFMNRRDAVTMSYFGKGIPVASGFDLNGKAPLDARTVVATEADRESMPDIQKYNGLTVFVEESGLNYQLVDGVWSTYGSETEVIDGLTSDSKTAALAAKQGKVLDGKITAHTTDEEKHLTTEERARWNDTYTKSEVYTKVETNSELDKKVNKADIYAGLDATEAGKVLDATQGKVIKDLVDTKADASTVTSELALKANKADLGTAASKNVGTTAGSVVEVGVDGKISSAVLPSISINETFVVETIEAAMALTVEVGDVVIVNPPEVVNLGLENEAEIDLLQSGRMTYICVDAVAEDFNEKFKPLQSANDTMSRHEIETLVANETTRATGVEAGLRTDVDAATSAIAAEVTRASGVEAGLRTDVDAATSAIAAEVTRAETVEALLQDSIEANADAIEAEVTRAKGEEGKLATSIAGNTSAIEAEVTRATEIEAGLRTDVDANAKAISAEVTRATGVEGKLQTDITTNTSLISAETARAIAAEEALQEAVDAVESAVSAETSRAEGAEGALQTAIEAEATRAKGEEGKVREEFATADTALKTELSGAITGVQEDVTAIGEDLTAHIGDTEKHITQAERTSWNARTRKATAVIGDGTATEYTVKHNLGTLDVAITVRENVAPYGVVFVDSQMVDENTVKFVFGFAPEANEFKAVIVG